MFGRLFRAINGQGGGGLSLVQGKHSLTPDRVFKSDPTAITPENPGTFDSFRSMPVLTAPRYFSEEEAVALEELSTKTADQYRYASRAYTAMEKIERTDGKLHRRHREYEQVVADVEYGKQEANADLADHLHGLRGKYARLGTNLMKTESKMDKEIEKLQSKIQGVW